jgi:diguanylate cyclase (GGDEF)-like protein
LPPATEKKISGRVVYPANASVPGIYMPRVQFAIRMTLGLLSGIYFIALPIPPFCLTRLGVGLIVTVFFVFHIIWWYRYLSRGVGVFGIRLAALVDVTAALTGVLVDPYEVPPAGLLVMIAVLGNGMQHGLKIFLEQFLTILLLLIPVFVARQMLFFVSGSYPLVFANIFIAICIYYVFMLLRRIELMKNAAERLARQDPLTKLYNRTAFIRAVTHLLSLHERKKMPLVLMFADLDDFKQVNDRLGHAFGDKVLRFFASLTEERLRKSDIVARYGGDEFVFMLVDMTINEAEQAALRLQHEFLQWADEQDLKVGVSFGLAVVPEKDVGLERLLKHVDAALYRAKELKGTRKIVIAPPLDGIE